MSKLPNMDYEIVVDKETRLSQEELGNVNSRKRSKAGNDKTRHTSAFSAKLAIMCKYIIVLWAKSKVIFSHPFLDTE